MGSGGFGPLGLRAGRPRPFGRLEAGAADDRQRRVAGIATVSLGSAAQPERRAAGGLDPSGVSAAGAQPRDWCRHGPGRQGAGELAERVGFEPTKSFDSALFKSAAINRSATSPPTGYRAGVRAQRGGRSAVVRRSGLLDDDGPGDEVLPAAAALVDEDPDVARGKRRRRRSTTRSGAGSRSPSRSGRRHCRGRPAARTAASPASGRRCPEEREVRKATMTPRTRGWTRTRRAAMRD